MGYFYYGLIFLGVAMMIGAMKASYNTRIIMVVFVIVAMFIFLTKKKRR